MLTAPNTNVPAVVSGLLVIHNTAASEIIAPTVDVSPTWPTTVPTGAVPFVMPPITFSSTVLSRRTQVRVSSSTMGILRDSDVVPVVQVFEGGIVTVRGRELFLSVVHLLPLSTGSPFTFTVLVIFFNDTFHYTVW